MDGPRASRPPAVRWSVASPDIGKDTDQWNAPAVMAGDAADGGDEETRTPDPLLAKEMLYQLSYVPQAPQRSGGRFWTRTRDLCLIRAVL